MTKKARSARAVSVVTVDQPPVEPHPNVPRPFVSARGAVEPNFAEGVENALTNPLRYLRLSVMAREAVLQGVDRDGMVEYVTSFITQTNGQINGVWLVLGELSSRLREAQMNHVAFEDRVRARVIVARLAEWLSWTSINRASTTIATTPHQLRIPEDIVALFRELAEIGVRLRMSWIEAMGTADASPAATPQTDLALAEQRLRAAGEMSPSNPAFVSSKKAAGLARCTTAALANARSLGAKSPDGLFGVDSRGRVWGKPGVNGHALYLRDSF